MKLIDTLFEGLKVIEPQVFIDNRGEFMESYNLDEVNKYFPGTIFHQDNQSVSKKGVLRGLHFQNPPFAQVKLVRVVKGSVLDVVVDIRKNSNTYGMHYKIELTAQNHKMLWIPEGFAHGFVALEEDSIFLYKCSSAYNKASEGCLAFNDPTLGIDWGIQNPIVSEKDLMGQQFTSWEGLF